MSELNPLPTYFETYHYKYFRYEDNVCLRIPMSTYKPENISLEFFQAVFNELTDKEQAKWIKWHLPESTYKMWS